MEEAGDLLEDSWFFGNLLHTKPRTISRCYSDLTSTSCNPIPTQEHVVKNERNKSSISSRKQPPTAPPSLTRRPSLPTFTMKSPNTSPDLLPFAIQSDQEDFKIRNERKSSSFSSRKQLPIAPSLPISIETQSFPIKNPNPNPDFTQTSSMSTSVGEMDEEDEDDQESEFTLGRLIRQASMNSSHTSNPSKQPSRQPSKAMTENIQKKLELDQEQTSDIRKMERNKSKNKKNSGKNKNGGPPKIPGGFVDRSSSADMKTQIKFWARAVASNVRQECS